MQKYLKKKKKSLIGKNKITKFRTLCKLFLDFDANIKRFFKDILCSFVWKKNIKLKYAFVFWSKKTFFPIALCITCVLCFCTLISHTKKCVLRYYLQYRKSNNSKRAIYFRCIIDRANFSFLHTQRKTSRAHFSSFFLLLHPILFSLPRRLYLK